MKNKTIFRVSKNKENPYVMVNKEWINDNKLSAKSKGILLYLLSKPDNWQVYETDIIKHMNDGRSSIRSGIKELLDEGYIHRQQKRSKDGKFGGYTYTVYEHRVRFSDNGNSDNRKTHTTNNNLTNNDLTNKEYKGKSSDLLYGEDFSFPILYKQIDKIMERDYPLGNNYNLSTGDIKNFFYMFYEYYWDKFNKKPSRLKNEQVENIINSIGCIGERFEPTLADYELIIENYFNQDFDGCDYGINHFVSGDVILMRCYDLKYDLD